MLSRVQVATVLSKFNQKAISDISFQLIQAKRPFFSFSFDKVSNNKQIAQTYLQGLMKVVHPRQLPQLRLHEVARDAVQSAPHIKQKETIRCLIDNQGFKTIEIGTIFPDKTYKEDSLQWRLRHTTSLFKELCLKEGNKPVLAMILAPGTHPSILDQARNLSEIAQETSTRLEWAVLTSACDEYAHKNTNKSADKLLEVSMDQIKQLAHLDVQFKVYISKVSNVYETKDLVDNIVEQGSKLGIHRERIIFSLGDTTGDLTAEQLKLILTADNLTPDNTILHLHNGANKWGAISTFFTHGFDQFDINQVACGGINPLSGEHKKDGQNLAMLDLITAYEMWGQQVNPFISNTELLTNCLADWEAITGTDLILPHPTLISSIIISKFK
tara:strand:+ start:228 stop:1382 length:1155 start_codon:yes stop_codon:yes gene_type:complete